MTSQCMALASRKPSMAVKHLPEAHLPPLSVPLVSTVLAMSFCACVTHRKAITMVPGIVSQLVIWTPQTFPPFKIKYHKVVSLEA